MKARTLLLLCLSLNLLLGAALLLAQLRRPASAPAALALPPASRPAPVAKTEAPPPAPPPAAPAAAFTWRRIESADYPQYIANLRSVDCPEWLIRDIIVADIDDLYQGKSQSAPAYTPPWRGADHRRADIRGQAARKYALQAEKRSLVRELLGYEWDSQANEVWNQDITASLLLGFLPDAKASQIVALVSKYTEAVQEVREDANFILIDQDRVREQALYDGLLTDASSVLNPGEIDELQLRAQAQAFFLANDLHFDGVGISDAELHSLARLSKSVKDMVRSRFVDDRNVPAEEQDRRQTAFDRQVKILLGAERYADYQRAQDPGFRETLDFAQKNSLPEAMAVKVFEARKAAEVQAAQVQADHSLSPDEQTAALAVLKAATARSVSSLLGGAYHDYAGGPGRWLETLAAPASAPAQQ